MTEDEFDFIESYLSSDHVVLEWGVGISTARLPGKVREFYSIEHDLEWFNRVKWMHSAIHYAKLEEDYIGLAGKFAEHYDRVLIDGRVRVKCAESLLANNLISKTSVIFVHDWHRTRYHGLRRRFEVIDTIPPITNRMGEIDKGLVALQVS